jgi:hypothetical protein
VLVVQAPLPVRPPPRRHLHSVADPARNRRAPSDPAPDPATRAPEETP